MLVSRSFSGMLAVEIKLNWVKEWKKSKEGEVISKMIMLIKLVTKRRGGEKR